MRIRPSRETVICVDIKPSELRTMADRFDKGGAFNQTISIFGSANKEGFEVRFIPIKEKFSSQSEMKQRLASETWIG